MKFALTYRLRVRRQSSGNYLTNDVNEHDGAMRRKVVYEGKYFYGRYGGDNINIERISPPIAKSPEMAIRAMV